MFLKSMILSYQMDALTNFSWLYVAPFLDGNLMDFGNAYCKYPSCSLKNPSVC